MNAQTTWLLPGFRGLLAGPQAADWRRWLGRAEELPTGEFGARRAFADALGADPRQLPWARATSTAELPPEAASRVLAIADPIQTRVEVFDLRMLGSGSSGLSAALIDQLLRDCNDYLREDGLTLIAGTQRWYLCGERADWPDPATLPTDSLLGSSLAAHLPESPQWQRLLNETQVFLNQYPPLQASRQAGQGSIDSLWYWGGAHAQWRPERIDWLAVEESDLKALGSAYGLGAEASSGGVGVVEGPGTVPKAIADALRRGTLALNFASGERFRLRPRDRWRFWVAPFVESG